MAPMKAFPYFDQANDHHGQMIKMLQEIKEEQRNESKKLSKELMAALTKGESGVEGDAGIPGVRYDLQGATGVASLAGITGIAYAIPWKPRVLGANAFKVIQKSYYDTMVFEPGSNDLENVLFQIPVGQMGRYYDWTNMEVGGMLCSPNSAHWKHVRVHFERYTSLESALWVKEKVVLALKDYQSSREIWHGPIAQMMPVLPKGGKKKISKMMKTGVVKFWPWLEGEIDWRVNPLDAFAVRLTRLEKYPFSTPVRIKVALGPWVKKPMS